MRGLVRAFSGDIEVLALGLGQGREFDIQLLQMGTSNLLVEFLRKHVNAERELLWGGPEGNLGEDLVGEGARHDEGRMSSSAPKVDETAVGKENDVTTVGHGVSVNLRLDVDATLGIGLKPGDVDFNVEVTDVADDGILRHDREVSTGDDVPITGSGDEDVGARSSVFHSRHLVSSHSGLKGVDRIDLGDENASTIRAQGLGTLESVVNTMSLLNVYGTYTLANVTETSDYGDLSGKHDIGGTLDTIDEGLAASIVVVKLGLGDRVIDVDGGDLEFALAESLVQMMNTSRGLLGDTLAIGEVLGVFFVHQGGEIATIIQDHVERLAIWERGEGLLDAPGILLLGFSFPGKDRNASGSNGGGSVILGREDVLRCAVKYRSNEI